MVPQIIWAGLVPLCVLAGWLVVRRPVRWIVEDRDLGRARALFRLQREGLEARFLASIARLDPIERLRWEEARWHDDVVWARDRQSRRLLALVGVHFDADPIRSFPDEPPRHATALFEFRKGRWNADGRHIDELRPDEAFLRHREFEPIVPPPRQRA
jgi:hypothetical protein